MKVLIAGLAKTGTTGLLYLIANSIGNKPRLLFEPQFCPSNLSLDSGDVIAKVLIGADLDAASFTHFDKKITIIRDPRDRMISLLLFKQFHANYLTDTVKISIVRELLERKESAPAKISIRKILEDIGRISGEEDAAVRFKENNVSKPLARFDKFASIISDSLLFKYEDFVVGKFSPLEKYLCLTISSGVVDLPDNFKRVKRTLSYDNWRNWFTAEDVEEYKPLLSPWLENYGYDPDDWTLNEVPNIEREHCSGYFMRLVEEARNTQAGETKAPVVINISAGFDTKQLIGRVGRAEPELVAGWVIGPMPSQPVRVALIVNGNEVAQTVADNPRPKLKERGMHPTGLCGFAFRFEPGKALLVGDEVVVSPVGDDFELENSPCIVAKHL